MPYAMEPLDDKNELKRMAPTLHGLPKADPFAVPDGFFERFPHAVQAAITAGQPAPRIAWPWWKRMAIALPIAATVGLAIWVLLPGNGPVESPAAAVTPLSDGELDALDDAEILAAFEDAETGDISTEDLGAVALQLDDHELLAYLEHEDADIEDLITDIE